MNAFKGNAGAVGGHEAAVVATQPSVMQDIIRITNVSSGRDRGMSGKALATADARRTPRRRGPGGKLRQRFFAGINAGAETTCGMTA